MDEIAGRPFWRWVFDAAGQLVPGPPDALVQQVAASGVADLFVLSHGWDTSEQDAEALCQGMFPLVAEAAAAQGVAPAGFVGVYWPSLWFPDAPAAALSGAQIAVGLVPSLPDHAGRRRVERMGRLIDEGVAGVGLEPEATQKQRLTEFHGLLQELVPGGDHAVEDSGETSLLRSDDPQHDYARISAITGSAPPGGDEQGLGDVFGAVWNGAKDALRAASYFEMKARAGTVGRAGLGPLLERLHEVAPGVRVHLVGHSFGARLVSYALAGTSSASASPVASLCLVQGAFSHWSFARREHNPFDAAGALSQWTDRVHGPFVATSTPYDWAVGQWYPRASFLARQNAEDRFDLTAQWGGMGADGFQGVTPSADLQLAIPGQVHHLVPGTFYRVDCSAVIDDTSMSPFAGAHSDIQHPEVAALLVAAAAAGGVPARARAAHLRGSSPTAGSESRRNRPP